MSSKAKTKLIISKVFFLATKLLVQSGQFKLQWRHLCFFLKVRREASGDTNLEPRLLEGVEARQKVRFLETELFYVFTIMVRWTVSTPNR